MEEDELGTEPEGITADQEARLFSASHHQRAMRAMDLGWLGRWFGGGAEKAGNIAMLTILLSFALMVFLLLVLVFDSRTQGDLVFKALAGVFSIVTLALGYVFGAHGAAKVA